MCLFPFLGRMQFAEPNTLLQSFPFRFFLRKSQRFFQEHLRQLPVAVYGPNPSLRPRINLSHPNAEPANGAVGVHLVCLERDHLTHRGDVLRTI